MADLENPQAQSGPEMVFAPSGADAALQPVWAKSQVELARALGCDRKTVQRMMKVDGNPGKTSDGRYNITAWKMWCAETGHLKKSNPSESRDDLEIKNQRLKNEKLEMENAVTRGELMHVDEVCRTIVEMLSGFVPAVRAMKHSLASHVVGESVPEASKRIGREADSVLQKLSLGEWAKKKAFWSTVFATLCDQHKRFSLGGGQSDIA